VVLIVLLHVCGFRALAQEPNSTDARLKGIEDAVRALTSQVAELTARLKPPQPPPSPIEVISTDLTLDISKSPKKGSTTAKIALVEFSDFQCPFCARHFQSTLPELQKTYIDTGKLQYVFRHLPLEQIHPLARQAAQAASCVGKQGKFWEYHDLLFLNQKGLSGTAFQDHAKTLKLNPAAIEKCLADPTVASRVTDDIADARRLGIQATPGFVIGAVQADGQIRIVRRIMGAQPVQLFRSVLDELLS
jgi:protein-disulfide isomerase